MKLMVVLLFSSFCALTLVSTGQDEKEFEGWMKTTQSTVGSLRKNLEAKNNDAVAQDAEKLAEVYKKVEGFWEARKVENAVKWSQQGWTAAGEIATAAKAGDSEKAGAGLKSLMGTCSACHTAYREKLPDGGYKIKSH